MVYLTIFFPFTQIEKLESCWVWRIFDSTKARNKKFRRVWLDPNRRGRDYLQCQTRRGQGWRWPRWRRLPALWRPSRPPRCPSCILRSPSWCAATCARSANKLNGSQIAFAQALFHKCDSEMLSLHLGQIFLPRKNVFLPCKKNWVLLKVSQWIFGLSKSILPIDHQIAGDHWIAGDHQIAGITK